MSNSKKNNNISLKQRKLVSTNSFIKLPSKPGKIINLSFYINAIGTSYKNYFSLLWSQFITLFKLKQTCTQYNGFPFQYDNIYF